MLRVTLVWTFVHPPPPTKFAVRCLSVGPQTFLRSLKQLLWISRFCKDVGHKSIHSCNFPQFLSWLQYSLYTICMVWLPYSISPSAHICHITSTVSRFLPTIWLPNSRLPSPYRLFYTQCCSINYKSRYMQIRNFISRTVSFSLYKTVNEPIQLHTAVHYNSWLWWTAMNLCLLLTVALIISLPSEFRRFSRR